MNGDAVKIQPPVYTNVPVETAMLATNLFGTTTQIAAPQPAAAAAHIPLITAAAAGGTGVTGTVGAPQTVQPAQHPQQQQPQQHPHQQQQQIITHTHAHAVAVAAAAAAQQQQQSTQTIQTAVTPGQVHLQTHPAQHLQQQQYGHHPAQQPTLPSSGDSIQANHAIDNTEYAIMNGAIAQTQDGNLVCYTTEALVPGVNNTNLVALEQQQQQQPELIPQQQQLAADECGMPLDKLKQMLATQLDYYFSR